MQDLKQKIERIFVLPFAKDLNVSPNVITLFSVIAMAFAFAFVFRYDLYLAALFTFISGYLDLLDGTTAKYHKKTSKFGVFLDRLGDRVSDILIISAVILAGLVLIFVVLSSYVSAILEAQTKTRIGERLSLRGLRIMIIVLGLAFNYITFAFYVLAILAVFAFVERFYTARKIL